MALQKILRFLAGAILQKYRPEIIGITGSVGKTSTKEAVFAVLHPHFNARRNIKNYNNEIGLPLTIIGASSGGRSAWLWLGAIFKAVELLLWHDKNYPKILVLEMGVDRIGDMKYLTDLAPCKIGIVTSVSQVHLEFFKTVEKIAREKSVMVSHLPKNGWAILNADIESVLGMKETTKARVLTFGIKNEQADLRALEINFSESNGVPVGLNFKLSYEGNIVPIMLPNILGEHFIYSALSAAAVGIVYGLNLVQISQALQLFEAPKGRLHLIDGIKNTFIIDDTYNASPESMSAALRVLGKISAIGKKIAVLGDMLELGDYTAQAHNQIGQEVFEDKIDLLITIGERARGIARTARESGLNEDKIFSFSNSSEAGKFLQERLEEGDLVLAKGSQGMRVEKVVKEIMAEPLLAKELLVRQDAPWY